MPDTQPPFRFLSRNRNLVSGWVFLPLWLTGVVGVIGCATASHANCLRWLGVFLLPFAAMPLLIIRQWLREGSVTWSVGFGSPYRPVTSDMAINRDEQPVRFWLVLSLFVAIALGFLVLSLLLLTGHWRLR